MTPGTKLGPYEIITLIGAGAMGEVYRAKDTKLGRDVALKILPTSFASDPERVARFRRDAQVLASLNHPHIAHIYGFEEVNATQFLALEFVGGDSLDQRMTRGAIPVDEALAIAKQIAEALETAHEQGIIHRDLKPANVKVRDDGTVKVLDFGLAKVLEPAASTVAANVSASPTITSPAMTHVGVILGTAAYMAPEQAKGKPADRRSDIWAFGCVLYEMLTGRRAFKGDDVSDTLANVLKDEPDWSALPAATPVAIRTLLRRCVTKDRQQRLQAIGEARIVLDDPAAEERGSRSASSSSWITVGGWGVAVLAFTAALAVGLLYARKPIGDTPEIRFSLLPPENATFALQSPAISPDGRRLAVVVSSGGHDSIWLREMDSTAFRPVPGTDDARWPFWSPDSRFLAFLRAAH
jgi:serine/threonine protein kinase